LGFPRSWPRLAYIRPTANGKPVHFHIAAKKRKRMKRQIHALQRKKGAVFIGQLNLTHANMPGPQPACPCDARFDAATAKCAARCHAQNRSLYWRNLQKREHKYKHRGDGPGCQGRGFCDMRYGNTLAHDQKACPRLT
jgi:hypothetical protein